MVVLLVAELGFNSMTGGHGSMEGKEVRFGIPASAMWAEATTVVSNGSVNAMHDSFSPLGGMIPLINIMLGEIIYGGIGAGMYGMLVFVFITVFFAGLMVGRTPEYIGKKIESREVQLSVLAIIGQTVTILFFAAAAVVTKAGLAGLNNQGPHGLSEILYAYSSTVGNNGSAFAGLSVNTVFYNVTLAFTMLVGRFIVIVPVLAIAGSLGAKTPIPPSVGTFATNNDDLRRPAGHHDHHPRGAELLPRADPRAHPGAFPDAQGHGVLSSRRIRLRRQTCAKKYACGASRSAPGGREWRSTSSIPEKEIRNPVMFMVWVGSLFITVVFIVDLAHGAFDGFNLQIAIWLWFTVLFANFSESMAEIQGKARADALRAMRTKTMARRLASEWRPRKRCLPSSCGSATAWSARAGT